VCYPITSRQLLFCCFEARRATVGIRDSMHQDVPENLTRCTTKFKTRVCRRRGGNLDDLSFQFGEVVSSYVSCREKESKRTTHLTRQITLPCALETTPLEKKGLLLVLLLRSRTKGVRGRANPEHSEREREKEREPEDVGTQRPPSSVTTTATHRHVSQDRLILLILRGSSCYNSYRSDD
jgi:hypothetical protein